MLAMNQVAHLCYDTDTHGHWAGQYCNIDIYIFCICSAHLALAGAVVSRKCGSSE